MIIAIIGPDGSGKTTIADMIVDDLNARGMQARHLPFRFGVLPPLSSLRRPRPDGSGARKARQEARTETATDASAPVYDLSENSPLRTLIYMSWYGVDYMLGGLVLRLRNIFGGKHHVAVFARYFYDYYYQSNNRRLPSQIKQAIELIVPRPQFIFFLDRGAQDIHDGKRDLPVEEIENQQRLIRERLAGYPQFHVIDARAGANETARAILRRIDG